MKFMIIGSYPKEKPDFSGFIDCCYQIADALLERNDTLIINSIFEDSADYWVYKRFVKKCTNIELHYLMSAFDY